MTRCPYTKHATLRSRPVEVPTGATREVLLDTALSDFCPLVAETGHLLFPFRVDSIIVRQCGQEPHAIRVLARSRPCTPLALEHVLADLRANPISQRAATADLNLRTTFATVAAGDLLLVEVSNFGENDTTFEIRFDGLVGFTGNEFRDHPIYHDDGSGEVALHTATSAVRHG